MKSEYYKSFSENLERTIVEIQKDFKFFKPINIINSDVISFELDGFKYEWSCSSNNTFSTIHLYITDIESGEFIKKFTNFIENYFVDNRENIYVNDYSDLDVFLDDLGGNIVEKKLTNYLQMNYNFKSNLLFVSAHLNLYKKLRKLFVSENFVFPNFPFECKKISIKNDDGILFSICFNGDNTCNYHSVEHITELYSNLLQNDEETKLHYVNIQIEGVIIDLNINDFKMFFNNLDYIYTETLEPLMESRIEFLKQKIKFKNEVRVVKNNLSNSNLMRKIKINNVLKGSIKKK